jgi:hypothetical protein
MDMDMQPDHGHAAWTQGHAARKWESSLDMDMKPGHGYAAWTWASSMDMDIDVYCTLTWTWTYATTGLVNKVDFIR